MAIQLTNSALPELDKAAAVPGYSRSDITPGILHIGVGNFHRAHQAVYLDQLFNLGLDHDWGLVGAGIKPYDAAMRSKLQKQDWLTTVVELDPKGLSARVCGAMIDFIETDPDILIDRLCQPDIRIVSLTITEGGYFVDPITDGFDTHHPEIVEELTRTSAPRTVFGILLAALERRRDAGHIPFTIMSCDNLPENGKIARQAVVGLARMKSETLARWIDDNVAFPCGMVDCITPATTDRERSIVQERFGIDDAAPVICEPFRQWVLEDDFPAGRPALENVGVEFVEDVAAYELMKLRILNGGHATIAYPAALLGYHFVHDAMADPLVRGFLDKLEYEEIIPTVPEIPGVPFERYLENVIERFSNPVVGDTVDRLCLDGSNRQPKFILPTLSDRLAAGASVSGLALEVAFWCRYCAATADDGSKITIVDERADNLTATALNAKENPVRFLEMTDVFGDLGDNILFREAFSDALASIWKLGTKTALAQYVGDGEVFVSLTSNG